MRQRRRCGCAAVCVNPLASAEMVLTEQEREMGVAVCDIGGGTTDLAIYVDGDVGTPWFLPWAATTSRKM